MKYCSQTKLITVTREEKRVSSDNIKIRREKWEVFAPPRVLLKDAWAVGVYEAIPREFTAAASSLR